MPSTITFLLLDPRLASQIYSNNGPSHLHYLEGTDKRFELKCTNPSKVFSLLSKLCKSKATGLDMISARLLRECADLIADPMCSIFNQSIRLDATTATTFITITNQKTAREFDILFHGS